MKNQRYLTPEVVAKLLDSISDIKYKMIFTLIYSYGLRTSECANLLVSDIDFKNKIIKIMPLKQDAKNKMEFPLLDNCAVLVRKYLKIRPNTPDCDYLIPAVKYIDNKITYKPISRFSIYKMFGKYASLIGMPKEDRFTHSLRHTYGHNMAMSGTIDIYTAKELLRHKDIKSTSEYYKITNKERDKRFMQYSTLMSNNLIAHSLL